jgi:hypothetical protein
VAFTAGNFALTISDLSSAKTSGTTAQCASCKRNSAEWIIERPEGCNPKECFLFALADFGQTTMSDNVARAGGGVAEGLNYCADSSQARLRCPLPPARRGMRGACRLQIV